MFIVDDSNPLQLLSRPSLVPPLLARDPSCKGGTNDQRLLLAPDLAGRILVTKHYQNHGAVTQIVVKHKRLHPEQRGDGDEPDRKRQRQG